jgi:hypothetical protein
MNYNHIVVTLLLDRKSFLGLPLLHVTERSTSYIVGLTRDFTTMESFSRGEAPNTAGAGLGYWMTMAC